MYILSRWYIIVDNPQSLEKNKNENETEMNENQTWEQDKYPLQFDQHKHSLGLD